MIGVRSSTITMNNQPELLVFGFFGALPRFAQEPGLFVARESPGFADLNLRRVQP